MDERSVPSAPWRERTRATIALLFAMSVAVCGPLSVWVDGVVVEESYLQFASYLDLSRTALIREGRLPLWAYHFGGGYPFVGHPDNPSLSPLFYLLVLPFGSGVGIKLMILASYAVGAVGSFALAHRALRLPYWPAVIVSSLFLFNTYLPDQINTGDVKDRGWLFLPLLLYNLLRSADDRRHVFYGACLVGILILDGFSLYTVSLALFVTAFAVLEDLGRPREPARPRLTLRALTIFACGVLMAAIKILPVLAVLGQNSRAFPDYQQACAGAMRLGDLPVAFLSPGPHGIHADTPAAENYFNFVMYFGWIPLFLFVLSAVSCFRVVWRSLVLCIVFLALALADQSPVDLFYLVWHLPLFHSMHETGRYFVPPLMILVPLVAAEALRAERFRRLPARVRGLAYAAVLVGALSMWHASRQYYDFTASLQDAPPPLRGEGAFFNVTGSADHLAPGTVGERWRGKYEDELPEGLQYFLLRQNVGLVNWYGNINLAERAVPRYHVQLGFGNYWRDLRADPTPRNGVFPNPAYQAEAHYEREGNTVRGIDWRANEVVVTVDQPRSDRLFLNQAYDAGWTSEPGTVFDAGGLLAVALPQPVRGAVRLHYRPLPFYVGAAISVVTLLLAAVWSHRPRRDGA